MVTTHNLGFPRIGPKRELKAALEAYWQGKSTRPDLEATGLQLCQSHWQEQKSLNYIPVGDFSFYDQVLDMSATLGNLPERVKGWDGHELDNYFRVARGQSVNNSKDDLCCGGVQAGEMTKWFDTNYHYIVPEFSQETTFCLNPTRLLTECLAAQKMGHSIKPVIIGPVTYLWLGKAKDGCQKLDLLEPLLIVYSELLDQLANIGVEWVQIDEPVLVTELDHDWQHALTLAYHHLKSSRVKLLLATYFGQLQDNLHLASTLPVAGFHLDAINASSEIMPLMGLLPSHRILSLGVINGRNIWKTDLKKLLGWLTPIYDKIGDRLWIAPSCSLLHVPVDLNNEDKIPSEIRSWLAFALQKIEELKVVATALNEGQEVVQDVLDANEQDMNARRHSSLAHDPAVKKAVSSHVTTDSQRQSPYAIRAKKQAEFFKLPLFPTTTIGSFPQTAEIRHARSQFKKGMIDEVSYRKIMYREIEFAVHEQEKLGLDVLVHGEAERNDMVEYFAEQLEGYVVSQFGWVQSYGSRCVKPPILYGDIRRPRSMTVDWIKYAQSLTKKPMKGMLTGPVTMLNWSFVRDDQSRTNTCYQLALEIHKEVLDLEQSGIRIIQIDEAALREGLPLRRSQWASYLDWAVESFRMTVSGVQDETQIHTHMCYSEFNDIIASIAAMDADVITIETSRSQMDLLGAFESFNYPNDIGPGVYDIHSPNIPSEDQVVLLMQKAAQQIPVERLWVNPDCGLKTRRWTEVIPALRNMVEASHQLRQQYTRN